MRPARRKLVEIALAALLGCVAYPSRVAAGLVLGVVLALGVSAQPIAAHALPTRANPPMDGKVATSPAKVEVWFSQEVDPNQTTLSVIAPNGGQVDRNDTAIDLYDPHHQHVTVSLKPNLAPGVYTVQWHSGSVLDSDAVDGSFTFTLAGAGQAAAPPVSGANVAAPTSAPLPAPLAASSAAPVAHQAAKPTNSSSSSSRTLVIVIIVVIALVLVGRGTRRTHRLPRHDGGADS